jgi:STE24 endopeptidase
MLAALYEVVLFAAGLPAGLGFYLSDRNAGLVHQGIGGWLSDRALALTLDFATAVVLGLVILFLVRRVRRWWIPAAAAVSVFFIAGMFAWPFVVEPMFNRFTPLPEGEVRREATSLIERAGLRAGTMLVMDASRRESRSNAYVSGLATTQRVVLYDTLLEDFPPREVAAVLAHEIGHRAHRDLLRGTLFTLPAIFAGFGAAAWFLRRSGHARGRETGPQFLPALFFVLFLLTTLSAPVANAVSRWMEADADTYSLELVSDPRAVLDAELRLARTNLSDPAPPEWARLIFFDHPSLSERVAAAEARVNDAPRGKENVR